MTVAVRRWPKWRKLERRELTWLLVGLTACVLLLVFFKLASEVLEGETDGPRYEDTDGASRPQ
jgi:hypothetical protein